MLVVCGAFAWAGNVTSAGIAAWDGQTWQSVGGGITAGSRIDAVAVYNGDLIATGTFTSIGGQSAANVARFDGTTWHAMGTGLNAPGRTLLVWNGELYAGGEFVTAGGADANRIARWNGSTWAPAGTGFDSGATHLAEYNGSLIAAGSFTTADGNPASKLAQWNGTAWSAVGSGLNISTITAVFVHDGNLLVSGTAGTIARTQAWNGSTWSLFGPSGFGPLYGFLNVNGTLVGCRRHVFIEWNGTVAWNGTDWQQFGGGILEYVYGAAIYNEEVYAFGDIEETALGDTKNIARLDSSGTKWLPVGAGMNDRTDAFTTFEGDLIVGGEFMMAGGVETGTIARQSGSQLEPMSNGLTTFTTNAFAEYQGTLYATGNNNISRWNGSAWEIPGGGTWGGDPNSLLVHKGELYVGGRFTKAGNKTVNNVARWNGSEWNSLGSGLGSFVFALAEYNGDLIVAGSFTTAGGNPALRIARWNGTQWSPLGSGIDAGTVTDMIVYNGELIVGGAFPASADRPPIASPAGTAHHGARSVRASQVAPSLGPTRSPSTRVRSWSAAGSSSPTA
jgi:hypothetical protein